MAHSDKTIEGGFPKPAQAATGSITASLLFTLALLSSVAPFATDLYLPGFPQMAAELGASASGVQLTLTTFLLGAALGQLVFGPLSDRCGRVPPLAVGALLCVAASAAAACASGVGMLVAARFLQGFAGSAGMVIGRAVVSDLAKSVEEAARAFSLMMLVVGIAPVIAPWLGSLLIEPLGWRGVLWVVFGVTLAMLAAVLGFVRESHPAQRRVQLRAQRAAAGTGGSPLLARRFLGNTLAFGSAFAAMIAYISASPFLFQVIVGLSVVQYGLLFAFISLLLAFTSWLSAHLAARVPPRRQLRFGLSVLLAASLALACVVFLALPAVWTIPPIAVAMGSLGFVFGNAISSAIAAVPRAAGAGSAVLGALQYGLGALVAPLVGLAGEHSAVPLALVMTTASLLALTAFLLAEVGEPEDRAASTGQAAVPQQGSEAFAP